MNTLSWLLFGLIVGFIAHAIDSNQEHNNLPVMMLLGVSGALIGGFVAYMVIGAGIIRGFNVTSFLMAVAGSLLVVFAGRTLSRIS